MRFKTILVAVDFSDHAKVAAAAARELAGQYEAALHFVHAFELVTPLVSPYQMSIPDLYLRETRDSAKKQLEALVAEAGASGAKASIHFTEAPAAPAIARVAKDIGADLIVMGTRGVTGLKHFVLGSVAERTLRLAPCSVLTVKSPGD
jgi:nucleotide-binding universal stress UspA family protein